MSCDGCRRHFVGRALEYPDPDGSDNNPHFGNCTPFSRETPVMPTLPIGSPGSPAMPRPPPPERDDGKRPDRRGVLRQASDRQSSDRRTAQKKPRLWRRTHQILRYARTSATRPNEKSRPPKTSNLFTFRRIRVPSFHLRAGSCENATPFSVEGRDAQPCAPPPASPVRRRPAETLGDRRSPGGRGLPRGAAWR